FVLDYKKYIKKYNKNLCYIKKIKKLWDGKDYVSNIEIDIYKNNKNNINDSNNNKKYNKKKYYTLLDFFTNHPFVFDVKIRGDKNKEEIKKLDMGNERICFKTSTNVKYSQILALLLLHTDLKDIRNNSNHASNNSEIKYTFKEEIEMFELYIEYISHILQIKQDVDKEIINEN
ncbi:MAG: hypothetical protein K6F77_10445, partial [Lachnospiraceae bacterium]|nr:hypothetical protein [Lachnospiraceae bacterium]